MSDDEWGNRSGDVDDRYDTDRRWSDDAESQSDDAYWGDQSGDSGEWGGSSIDPRGPTAGSGEPEHHGPKHHDSEHHGPEPLGRLTAGVIGGVAGFAIAVTFNVVPVVGTVLGLAGPVIGGGIAGYLRGSNTKESTLTGALAGVVGSIPLVLFAGLVLVLFGALLVGDGGDITVSGGLMIVAAFIVVFAVVLSAVLSAIGGAIGAGLTDRREP